MPPAPLMAPNAASRPSFICRPSSLAGPLNGAAMPKRISLSVTPLTTAARDAGAGMTGTAAATDVGAAAGAAAGAPGAGTGTTAVAVGGAARPDPSSNVTGAAGGTMTGRTDGVELDASCGAAA